MPPPLPEAPRRRNGFQAVAMPPLLRITPAAISAARRPVNVVPMKPTPFMDAVMTGSPDQVRQESYKQRVANIRSLWSRTTTNQKELIEGIQKDASRPDIWTIF